MEWLLLAVVLVGLGALIVGLVMRFNQLSLNRSLVTEARRQYARGCASRHSLVPTFLVAAREAIGDTVETHRVESALRVAAETSEAEATGPAEYRLSLCIAEVAAAVKGASGPAGHGGAMGAGAGTGGGAGGGAESVRSTSSRALARDLFRQLRTQETHIAAAARHHNTSVRGYENRRTRLTSLLHRPLFRPLSEIEYSLTEIDTDVDEATVLLRGEDYRPGRVSEDL